MSISFNISLLIIASKWRLSAMGLHVTVLSSEVVGFFCSYFTLKSLSTFLLENRQVCVRFQMHMHWTRVKIVHLDWNLLGNIRQNSYTIQNV